MYRPTAQTNRSSVRPQDNDGDGLLDDAWRRPQRRRPRPQMRKNVGAGNGDCRRQRDPSGRSMRGVGQGRGDYTFQRDNPGADAVGGLDLHRNYPYNWRPIRPTRPAGVGRKRRGRVPDVGAGDARARLADPNPNIGVVNTMDTPVRWSCAVLDLRRRECMKTRDITLIEDLDKVGQRLTGYTRAGNVYLDYAVQPPRQAEGSTPQPSRRSRCSAMGPTSATSSSAPSGTATSTGSPAAA